MPCMNLTCRYMQFGQGACMFHISYGLQWRQGLRYIADSATRAQKAGVDDITGFFGPSFLPIRWKYGISIC